MTEPLAPVLITTSAEPVPSRKTPGTFSSDMDTLLGKLPAIFTQMNASTTNVSANATAASEKAVVAAQQANLATTNGAAQVALAAEQVALATTQANLATTNGAAQVARAAQQAALATTNGQTQVNLASAQVTLAAQQATTATTQASIAASVANFKGIWGSLAGALNYPSSVYLDGLTYRLLVNLPDVTLSNPSTDTAKWSVIDGVVPTAVVGDINSPIYDLPLRNSLTPLVGVGAVTFSRAGAATHINRYGKIIDLATGVPGYDADGIDLPCESTNLLTYSEDFSNAAWPKIRTTIISDAIASPNSNITADKLVETATTGAHHTSTLFVFIAGTYYTLSVRVKALERATGRIQLGNGVVSFSGMGYIYADYNLLTKTVTNNTGDPKASTIKEMADGWFRVTISGLAQSSGTDQIFSTMLSNGTTITYTGDGTSGLYIWGAQLEALPLPTPYIKTEANPMSRVGASLSFPYAENMPGLLYSKTITFDVDVIGTIATYAKAFSSGDVIFMISSNTVNDKKILVSIGGTGTGSTVIIKDGKFKFSLTYDAVTNIGSLYVDGVKMATMTRTTIATALSMIDINQSAISYMKIKNLRIYDKCFTPEQMRLI